MSGLDFAGKKGDNSYSEWSRLNTKVVIPAISVLADTEVLGPCPILVNDEIVNMYHVYSSRSDTT